MGFQIIDWGILILFFVLLLLVGYFSSRNAGKNSTNFFLSGRNMPWWVLGISMVATTFANDTPTLVTDMVRSGGVASNWLWWAFLLTGMMTVFLYAKLWNRSRVMTDNEFYEIRYSGKTASFLRGFRSIYLGFFFNVFVIAGSSLAFLKMAGVILDIKPIPALFISSIIILFYSTLGGLKAILWTDVFQFSFAMVGAILAAIVVVRSPEINGLDNLLAHPNLTDKLNLIPSISQPDIFLGIFLIPLAVQWWAVWYPGAEPGGGGHVVQRMLSAKNENHAIGATFMFNLFHYALRPWPWIIVALASLIIFPDLESMRVAFPGVNSYYVQDDLAYYAMLMKMIPPGLLGIIVASLIAAYMSTVASLLNWGSSYLVNDFYGRFWNKNATERQKVVFGRLSTVMLMVSSVLFALVLQSALQLFNYTLMIGAGTGLIYLLRWFWWRINAFSELSAMISAVIFSLCFIIYENTMHVQMENGYIPFFDNEISLSYWNIIKFISIVLLTTLSWITVTFLTNPVDDDVLRKFYCKIRPGGPGWRHVVQKSEAEGIVLTKDKSMQWDVPTGLLCMFFGSISIYSILFATGHLLYGTYGTGFWMLIISLISTILLIYFWRKLVIN